MVVAANMWQFYQMESVARSSGDAAAFAAAGRIGTEANRRLDPYPDTGAALSALAAIARPNVCGGYVDRRS